MKAMKKDMAGVSPVIAVILMVAITVVLAGVVFLWAQSFTSDTGDTVKTLNIKCEIDRNGVYDGTGAAGDEDQALLVIDILGGTINWDDYKVMVNGLQVYSIAVASLGTEIAASISTNIITQSTAGDTVNFGQDGTAIDNLVAGTPYNVKIVDIDGNRVAYEADIVATN